ncbi:MAG TPA: IS3 family transposase [Bacillales bacterium]|nr:IS3 family transposase [Bacillales bacterium]
MRTRVHYPEEIKWKAIEMKQAGYTKKEIMDELGIRNKTQIQTWMRWYQKGETHRFAQPVGKQYSYGKGVGELSKQASLEMENRQLKMQLEILKKVQRNREEMVPEVAVELIETLKDQYPVYLICKEIGLPRSSYYRWKRKTSQPRSKLEVRIEEICIQNKYRYGHRKITALLRRKHQIKVNRKTVQRIMQKKNLQCRVKQKRKTFINGESKIVVENRLNQNFSASKPNEKWVTDITYLPFGPKMLYLSSIMDLYNNEIIAYDISDRQDVSLVLKTLEKAANQRQPTEVILHSDQGSVYTSYAYQNQAKEKGITTSMSRKGNCHDNAVIESFHASLKSETFYAQERKYLSTSIVQEIVQEYILYYNQERIQEKLNYLSPIEYRQQVA